MKVFKRGGFIILDQAGTEIPIPVGNFDYSIIAGSVKIRDVAENIGYSAAVVSIQDEFGAPIGTAVMISAYFAVLTTVSSGGGDASAANQVLEITELQNIVTALATSITPLTVTSIPAKTIIVTDLAVVAVAANSNRRKLVISVDVEDCFVRELAAATDNAIRKGIFLKKSSVLVLEPDVFGYIYQGEISIINVQTGESPVFYIVESE